MNESDYLQAEVIEECEHWWTNTERKEHEFLDSIESLGSKLMSTFAAKIEAATDRFNMINEASIEWIIHQI